MNPTKTDLQKAVQVTLENIEIAKTQGLNGVFLINHSFPALHLIQIYKTIKEKIKDFFIGINFLGV